MLIWLVELSKFFSLIEIYHLFFILFFCIGVRSLVETFDSSFVILDSNPKLPGLLSQSKLVEQIAGLSSSIS